MAGRGVGRGVALGRGVGGGYNLNWFARRRHGRRPRAASTVCPTGSRTRAVLCSACTPVIGCGRLLTYAVPAVRLRKDRVSTLGQRLTHTGTTCMRGGSAWRGLWFHGVGSGCGCGEGARPVDSVMGLRARGPAVSRRGRCETGSRLGRESRGSRRSLVFLGSRRSRGFWWLFFRGATRSAVRGRTSRESRQGSRAGLPEGSSAPWPQKKKSTAIAVKARPVAQRSVIAGSARAVAASEESPPAMRHPLPSAQPAAMGMLCCQSAALLLSTCH